MNKTIFKYLLLFFTLLFAQTNFAYGVHEKNPYAFTITKHIYKFHEFYQIKPVVRNETYIGTVKNSWFRVRTNYDLSDANGWQATGAVRIFSLGLVFPWGKDIDISDTRGVQIGLIDGDIATFEAAKYNIYEYNEAGIAALVGIAYASKDFHHFSILPSANDTLPIVEFNRDMSSKSWTVTVHNPEKIDDRIIRIFAAFIIHYQDKFVPPPENH